MSNNFDGPILFDTLDTTSLANYLAFGRTGSATPSGPQLGVLNVSPAAGAGVAANLGTLALRYDAGNVSTWQKTGAADTAWTQLSPLSGSVTLTAIDTTATAAFQWTMADAAAAAVSLGAAGALNMMVFDTTNGTEHIVINAASGLWIADLSELRYGTPGTDVVHSADGADEVITGTGDVVYADDFDVAWGTAKTISQDFDSVGNRYRVLGASVTDVAATAATAAVLFQTGNRVVNAAGVGTGSGGFAFTSGSTDSTDAGGTAGASGGFTFTSGDSTSTLGTSGNTGSFTVVTGNSTDADSGSIVLTTGTAGGTRGVLDINVATIDLTTQGTFVNLIDNTNPALVFRQGTDTYLSFRTSNGSEEVDIGNTTLNPAVTFDTHGAIRTDGIDHGTRLVLTEEFQQRPLLAASIAANNASKTWEVAGTNAADAGSLFDAGGGIALTTQAGGADQQIIIPNTTGADNSQSPWQGTQWSTSDSVIGKFNVKVIDIANAMFFAGFKITTTIDTGTDANQLFVGANSAGTLGGVAANWVVVESNNGVDTQTDTTVAVATGSWRIVIAWAADRTAQVFLNGTLRRTTAAYQAGVVTMKPMAGVQELAAAGRQFTVQRISCSKLYS